MAIIFHTINGIGLGHLTRQIEIAKELKKIRSDISVYFLTSAEWHSHLIKENFPFYYIPSAPEYRITGVLKEWEPLTGKELSRCSPPGLAEEIFNKIVQYHSPVTVIFDSFFPFEETITMLRKNIRCFCVIDSYSRLEGENFKSFIKEGGKVFVCSYNKTSELVYSKKVTHVGRIIKGDFPIKTNQKNKNYKEFHIISAQGGGGFRKGNSVFYSENPEFSNVVSKAFEEIKHEYGDLIRATFILGPYGTKEDANRMPSWVKVEKSVTNLPKLMSDADLFISRGGYSAVSDSITSACPGIYLPIEEPVENQTSHIKTVEDEGIGFLCKHSIPDLVHFIEKLIQDPEKLSKARKLLKEKRSKSKGAQLIAENIYSIVPKKTLLTHFKWDIPW